MNKRIQKKKAKGRPVYIKTYHTARQVAYKTANAIRKMGYRYHGFRTGRWSSGGGGGSNIQQFPRTDNFPIQGSSYFIPILGSSYFMWQSSYPGDP